LRTPDIHAPEAIEGRRLHSRGRQGKTPVLYRYDMPGGGRCCGNADGSHRALGSRRVSGAPALEPSGPADVARVAPGDMGSMGAGLRSRRAYCPILARPSQNRFEGDLSDQECGKVY
jgi:hypothetical protein